jgi:hypothetical protein
MSPAEVTEKLQLHKLKDHLWFVHPSCATTAEGLFEGLVPNTPNPSPSAGLLTPPFVGLVIAKRKTESKIMSFISLTQGSMNDGGRDSNLWFVAGEG